MRKLADVIRLYDKILHAPHPAMNHKIALTAWTRIDKLNDFHKLRIVRFMESDLGFDHHPH